METFELAFRSDPRQPCRVRAGVGALDALVDELASEPPGRMLVVVSDANVMPLHGGPIAGRLRERGLSVRELEIPAGESSKTRETKAVVEDRLAELGAGRDVALVAVGGGVTGDLAGFVAATWHRGVPVVQVPTSLLAMVDASLGGKTAVNLESGKNLVGSVHQPWGVYADPTVLATLPEAEYTSGFAEVIKAATIADVDFFGRLEASAEGLKRREPEALNHAILRCMQIKCEVVGLDERETGRRAVLNFGHTVGHAVESVSGYRIGHGFAVAMGMCVEAELARNSTNFPPTDVDRLRGLVAALGLPVQIPAGLDVEAVIAATRRDKKARSGEARYALPVRIGRMPPGEGVTVPVEENRLREILVPPAMKRPD